MQSTFGKAVEREEGSTGGKRPSSLTDMSGLKIMPAVNIISEKVIISSTRSEEGKLLLKYFSRMTARIHENCMAPLLRAVRLRIAKPNLLTEIK